MKRPGHLARSGYATRKGLSLRLGLIYALSITYKYTHTHESSELFLACDVSESLLKQCATSPGEGLLPAPLKHTHTLVVETLGTLINGFLKSVFNLCCTA